MVLIGDNNFLRMMQRIWNTQNLKIVKGDARKGEEMIIFFIIFYLFRICHYLHFKDNVSK